MVFSKVMPTGDSLGAHRAGGVGIEHQTLRLGAHPATSPSAHRGSQKSVPASGERPKTAGNWQVYMPMFEVPGFGIDM